MPDNSFKDHFSGHAAAYASARPNYPPSLFDFLADNCAARDCAWDCATGNGQAALELAVRYRRVVATDASAMQIAAAPPHERLEYRVATAENSGLETASIDLVTVAQALHWFDLDRFFNEVSRVVKPGGMLAVWCYGLCQVTATIDRIVFDYYESLATWWPPERRLVERGYSDITLPFALVECPQFTMQQDWSADDMLSYLSTWSATRRCSADTGSEPVAAIAAGLRAAWGPALRAVNWPLFLKVGRNL